MGALFPGACHTVEEQAKLLHKYCYSLAVLFFLGEEEILPPGYWRATGACTMGNVGSFGFKFHWNALGGRSAYMVEEEQKHICVVE